VLSPSDILSSSALRFGDKPALVTAHRAFGFRELDVLSDRVAAGLAQLGVQPGQPVSLCFQNRWEWVVGYHGALRAGAVVNPVNVMLTVEKLALVLRDRGAGVVFTSAEQGAKVVEPTRDLPRLRTVVTFGGEVEGASASRLWWTMLHPPHGDSRANGSLHDRVHLDHDGASEGRRPEPPSRSAQLRAHRHAVLPHRERRRGHCAAGTPRLRQRRDQRHLSGGWHCRVDGAVRR
jgi:hypothetical protein